MLMRRLKKKTNALTQNKTRFLLLCIPGFLIALYLIPYIIFGENAHIPILDNLDANVASFKVLAESGQIFGGLDATIPNFMGGLPRNVLGSEFNVMLWLYYFFEPYTAYVLNLILIRIIAFIGMVLLLKRHIVKGKNNDIIVDFIREKKFLKLIKLSFD